MSQLNQYIKKRSARDKEFKLAFEEESIRLELVRAREARGLSQRELAKRLGVSQPRIAQVERGSKPMSSSFLIQYAAAVELKVQLAQRAVAEPRKAYGKKRVKATKSASAKPRVAKRARTTIKAKVKVKRKSRAARARAVQK